MIDAYAVLDYLDAAFEDGSVLTDTAIAELSDRDESWLARVTDEFSAGFRLMRDRGPCVTVFGSARIARDTPTYAMGRAVGGALARAGFTVVTGGGPGLMEAANRGALDAGGDSIGLGITLPSIEPPNYFTTASIAFRYFFVRKVMLVKYASAFVLLPGGMGTLDELYETLNLIQTRKIQPFPVILVGKAFWQGLVDWMQEQLAAGKLISPSAMDLFLLEDDPEAVAQLIRRWRDTGDPTQLEPTAIQRAAPRSAAAPVVRAERAG